MVLVSKPITPFYQPNASSPVTRSRSTPSSSGELRSSPHSHSSAPSIAPYRRLNGTAARVSVGVDSTPQHLDSSSADSHDSTSSPGSDSDSSTYDSGTSTSNRSSAIEETIPKPHGEPGRPGRGGYNLKLAVGWPSREYKKLQDCVYQLIDNHLDTTTSISAQSLQSLKLVKVETIKRFPGIQKFEGLWPIDDLVMMRLKHLSSRARQAKAKNAMTAAIAAAAAATALTPTAAPMDSLMSSKVRKSKKH